MRRFHVKKGDEVVVIAGNHKGRKGKVLEVLAKRESVVIEATDERGKEGEERDRLISARLHHRKKSQQNPNGALVWLPGPVHVSNVMLASRQDKKLVKRHRAV
ncbi:MAG: KOW motif-containing protein [Limisphaerales bacterium]